MRRSHSTWIAWASLALCVFLAGSFAAPARAQWTFSLVADSSTGINPGGYASISGQEVMFNNDLGTRLYKHGPTGVPVLMFQTGVAIPNTPDNFTYLSYPFSFDGHTFAFFGGVAGGGAAKSGSYAFTSAGLEALAGYGTANTNAGRQAIDGDDVAYGGSSAIRVRRGGVTQVIDSSTTLPGGLPGPTNNFGALDFEAGTVVFAAQYATSSGFKQGIFFDRGDGTGIHKLVNTDDVAPGGTQKFLGIGANRPIAIDGDDVLFVARLEDPGPCPPPLSSCGRSGLFLSRGLGPPQIVAIYDPLAPTTLPGGPEHAGAILELALSNGDAAFTAGDDLSGQNSVALFAVRNGVLERVVGTGDTLGTTLVDAIGGGNEMREGDTLAFVVYAPNSARSVWRADYGGLPAVSNSGLIANGSFASGLSSWIPSSTGQIAAIPGTTTGGPAVQLTADPSGGPAGPASLSQTIPLTPNNSFAIDVDYRFTTTTGSFEVLLNGVPLSLIQAPATVSQAFTRTQVVVNDLSLMGLTNAVLTLRLNPGSLADLLLRGIFSPLYALLSFTEAKADTWAGTGLGNCTQFDDHDVQPVNIVAQATTQAVNGSNASSATATALNASLGPLFGGVQWTMGANAASASTPACARAETYNYIRYIISGVATAQPVPVDQQLLLTGYIELTGDFTQSTGATRARVRVPVKACHSENCPERWLLIEITPATRQVSEIIPTLADRNHLNDLTQIVSAAPQTIVATFTGPPGGPDTSRRYDIAVQYVFLANTYARFLDIMELDVGRSEIEVSADPSFNGTVVADFTQTFGATLTSSAPGIQLLALDGDGDGVPVVMDNCPAASNPGQEDGGGVGAGSAPDGIGDACQCGDVNDDGFVTGSDGTLVKRAALNLAPFVAGVGALAAPQKCDVNGGASGDAIYHCSGIDGTLIQRASLGLAPGVVQACPAADGS